MHKPTFRRASNCTPALKRSVWTGREALLLLLNLRAVFPPPVFFFLTGFKLSVRRKGWRGVLGSAHSWYLKNLMRLLLRNSSPHPAPPPPLLRIATEILLTDKLSDLTGHTWEINVSRQRMLSQQATQSRYIKVYQRGAFSVHRRELGVDANVHREHLCKYNQTSQSTITRVSIIQTGTLH